MTPKLIIVGRFLFFAVDDTTSPDHFIFSRKQLRSRKVRDASPFIGVRGQRARATRIVLLRTVSSEPGVRR
jgi:hypothetical protein